MCRIMKKQILFAAPILAAMTFVCQPVVAQDRDPQQSGGAAERAASDAGRAADRAGDAAAGAADRTGQAASGAADRTADSAARVAGARDQAGGSKDQKCAAKIADVNNFEIQAGRLAQQKAQSDEIKQFAKMMVDDHTQAQQQLQQIAQRKGMQFSQQLMPVHQTMLQELNKLEGQEFERAYLYGQVAGHTKTALKLRDDKTELQDPELKQYAATILPKVQQHLQHAQKLANADEAITAGARIGADHDNAKDSGGGTNITSERVGQDRTNPGAGTDRNTPPAPSGQGTPGTNSPGSPR